MIAKRLLLLVILAVCLAHVLFSVGLSIQADEINAIEGQAYAIVDGTEVPLELGTVIATGSMCPDGTCDIPRTAVVFKGTKDSPNYVSFIATVTPTCELVMTDITFEQDGSPDDGIATDAIYSEGKGSRTVYDIRGWAKSEYNDFIGLDISWVRAEMKHKDNLTSVYGGYDLANNYGHMFHFKCLYAYGYWYPYGDFGFVLASQNGVFELIAGGHYHHAHLAHYKAWPNLIFELTWYYSGNPVPGGEWRFAGGRDIL